MSTYREKKIKLKEILALVDSISDNLFGVSTQLQGSGSAGKVASWKKKNKLEVFLWLQLTTKPKRIIL